MSDDLTFTLEESTGSGEYDLIPDGTVVPAKVVKVAKEKTNMTDEVTGEKVEQIVFSFALLTDDYGENRRVFGRTSTKFTTHPNCKLHAWVLELMAANELPAGFKLNLQDLVGNECRVAVEVNTWEDKKQDPDPETGKYPEKSNNKVTDVIRAANTGVATASFLEEPF